MPTKREVTFASCAPASCATPAINRRPPGARAAHGTAHTGPDQDPAHLRQQGRSPARAGGDRRRRRVIRDRDEVLRAVASARSVLSTGIGNGVAIPHGKSGSVTVLSLAAGVSSHAARLRGAGRAARSPLLPSGRAGVGRGAARQGAQPDLPAAAARLLPLAPGRRRHSGRVLRDHPGGRSRVIRWLRGWGPALVCAALIFFASSRPTVPVPLPGHSDKVAHFAAYSVLGFALGYARQITGMPLAGGRAGRRALRPLRRGAPGLRSRPRARVR